MSLEYSYSKGVSQVETTEAVPAKVDSNTHIETTILVDVVGVDSQLRASKFYGQATKGVR